MPLPMTGSLPLTPTQAANYPAATQAADMGQLLEAVGWKLRVWTQMRDRVKEWDNPDRPPIEGDDTITYRIAGLQPGQSPGGGIARTPVDFEVEVTVWTVRRVDATGDNTAWNRRHWATCLLAINALHSQHLAPSYNAQNLPSGPPITTAAVTWVGGDPFDKQPQKADWGKTVLTFTVPTQMPLVNPGRTF